MSRERLTPTRIDDFRCPSDKKQVFLWDSVMPRLAVRATPGSKSFIFETKVDRATMRLTIGDVRAWVLDSVWAGKGAHRHEVQRGARQEAARLQALVDQGIDPREQERQEKAARAARRAEEERARKESEGRALHTLRALLDAYSNHLDKTGKSKSAAATRTMFKNHIFTPFPLVADKPAREVTPLEVAAIIRKVTDAGKQRAAGVLRSYLHAAYGAASRAPYDVGLPTDLIPFAIEVNPVQPIKAIPVRAGTRTLAPEELRDYIRALGDDLTDQALRLALYAGGQRMAQLIRARVEDWSPDTKTLRLFDPKGRRLVAREHLLPLAPKAAAMVAQLVARAKEAGTPWLFAHRLRKMDPGTPGKRLAEIRAEIGAEDYDLKDVRRTAETMLAGMGVSRDVRAQLLSHGLSGVQVAHYDMHQYTEEKRRALVAWEQKLEALRTGKKAAANVTSIKRRAKA